MLFLPCNNFLSERDVPMSTTENTVNFLGLDRERCCFFLFFFLSFSLEGEVAGKKVRPTNSLGGKTVWEIGGKAV